MCLYRKDSQTLLQTPSCPGMHGRHKRSRQGIGEYHFLLEQHTEHMEAEALELSRGCKACELSRTRWSRRGAGTPLLQDHIQDGRIWCSHQLGKSQLHLVSCRRCTRASWPALLLVQSQRLEEMRNISMKMS